MLLSRPSTPEISELPGGFPEHHRRASSQEGDINWEEEDHEEEEEDDGEGDAPLYEGKLRRKTDHKVSLFRGKYQREVQCWLEDSIMHIGLHVSGESEEAWDLCRCGVVIPDKKMDRFRLRMDDPPRPAASDDDYSEEPSYPEEAVVRTREVSLRASSVRQAQGWLRAIMVAKEVAHATLALQFEHTRNLRLAAEEYQTRLESEKVDEREILQARARVAEAEQELVAMKGAIMLADMRKQEAEHRVREGARRAHDLTEQIAKAETSYFKAEARIERKLRGVETALSGVSSRALDHSADLQARCHALQEHNAILEQLVAALQADRDHLQATVDDHSSEGGGGRSSEGEHAHGGRAPPRKEESPPPRRPPRSRRGSLLTGLLSGVEEPEESSPRASGGHRRTRRGSLLTGLQSGEEHPTARLTPKGRRESLLGGLEEEDEVARRVAGCERALSSLEAVVARARAEASRAQPALLSLTSELTSELASGLAGNSARGSSGKPGGSSERPVSGAKAPPGPAEWGGGMARVPHGMLEAVRERLRLDRREKVEQKAGARAISDECRQTLRVLASIEAQNTVNISPFPAIAPLPPLLAAYREDAEQTSAKKERGRGAPQEAFRKRPGVSTGGVRGAPSSSDERGSGRSSGGESAGRRERREAEHTLKTQTPNLNTRVGEDPRPGGGGRREGGILG